MLIADVNIFVYAHRADTVRHAELSSWLDGHLNGGEPFGVSELVLSSLVRIVTNHRVFVDPTPIDIALDFCATVLAAPASLAVRPGPRHWVIFDSLCRRPNVRANTVPDAYLAALALEQGATLATLDAGFRRFDGLRVETPI